MIEIMNLRKEKPAQPYDFRIDRTSPLGNPFPMKHEGQRNQVCAQYDGWFKSKVYTARDTNYIAALNKMLDAYKAHGRLRLFCWCAPKQCHGETIKQFLMEELVVMGADIVKRVQTEDGDVFLSATKRNLDRFQKS